MTTYAFLYTAKSTEDRNRSLVTQEEDGLRMIEAEGWTLVRPTRGPWAGGVAWSDEGFSAYSGNRGPGLAAIRAEAARLAAGQPLENPVMLVCQAADRISRGAGDAPGAPESLMEVWIASRRANVHLRSYQDDYDLQDLAAVANLSKRAHGESKRKSDAVRDGHKRRREDKGLHPGGRRPFGYEYERYPDGKVIPGTLLRVHSFEAAVWRKHVWEAGKAGASVREITQRLSVLGVPPVYGKQWHPSSVTRLLSNPLYAGKRRHVPVSDGRKRKAADGVIVDAGHPALVDWDEWQEFQRTRRGTTGGSRRGGRKPSRPALFVNRHLRCGHCGATMGFRHKPNRASDPWEVYQCNTREKLKERCEQKPVDAAAVEQAAIRALALAAGSATSESRIQLADRHADLELSEAQLADAQRLVLTAEGRVQRVDDDYGDGRLSAEHHERLSKRFGSELGAARAAAEQTERHLKLLRERAADVDPGAVMRAALESLADALRGGLAGTGSLDEARLLLRAAFPTVTLLTAGDRIWVHLGTPTPEWVAARIDDEMGERQVGEPVLADPAEGYAATDPNVLTTWSVIAEVEL